MMSNELTPIEQETITQPAPIHEITRDELPPLLPQQMIMLNYIIDGDNYSDAYRKAGYKSNYPKQASFDMINRNPLKAWLDYYYKEMAKKITPEYITLRLQQIMDMATNSNNPVTFNPETAIKAVQEINKMQGNHKQQAIQINNLNASIDDLRKAKSEYIKEY